MTLELFFENENGQLEVNFESLALLTSEEFVNVIKSNIEHDYRVIDIQMTKNMVYVYLIEDRYSDYLRVYMFNIPNGLYWVDKMYSGFIKVFIEKGVKF